MRERIEDMAGLAAALREVADRVAPAQTEWWIGPFEWHGGECPVPPGTLVRWDGDSREQPSGFWLWVGSGRRGQHFSYAADNPEGWLARPDGWVPPESAFPIETRCQDGLFPGRRMYRLMTYAWRNVTHIRLLPRPAVAEPGAEMFMNLARANGERDRRAVEAASKPTPVPADVREVVRETVARQIDDFVRQALKDYDVSDEAMRGDPELWQSSLLAADAVFTALDAAPAEGETVRFETRESPPFAFDFDDDEPETLGYAIMDAEGTVYCHRYRSVREAKEAETCKPGRRIVRLVEENGDGA